MPVTRAMAKASTSTASSGPTDNDKKATKGGRRNNNTAAADSADVERASVASTINPRVLSPRRSNRIIVEESGDEHRPTKKGTRQGKKQDQILEPLYPTVPSSSATMMTTSSSSSSAVSLKKLPVGKIPPRSKDPIPSTSAATTTTTTRKKVKTKTKASKPPPTYAGKQPTLFDTSSEEEDLPLSRPNPPTFITKKTAVNNTTTKKKEITPPSPAPSSTFSKDKKDNIKTNFKENTPSRHNLKECSVFLTPSVFVPPSLFSKTATITKTEEVTGPSTRSKKGPGSMPPPSPSNSIKNEQKKPLIVVEEEEEGETKKKNEKVVQNTDNKQEQEGRSLRPRGKDKKAVNNSNKSFSVAELNGVLPYALASQCRMVAGGLTTAWNDLSKVEKMFDKKAETILAKFGNSIKKLQEKKKSTVAPKPNLKRLRTLLSEDAEETLCDDDDDDNKKNGSIDMTNDAQINTVLPHPKITFDFVVAAEMESVPIQASKKIILNPEGSTIVLTRRSERESNIEANQHGEKDDDDEEEDIFEDVFERSSVMIVDDDNNMPSRGRSVGVVYSPDVTYLNPNATFVKDIQNKPSKKVDEMLLNKTVSLPSGSSAFGKHVPQFDFSSSRHQLSNLEILEKENDGDSSPPDCIPKSIFPDGLGGENRDEERKKKEKTSTSSSSSSTSSVPIQASNKIILNPEGSTIVLTRRSQRQSNIEANQHGEKDDDDDEEEEDIFEDVFERSSLMIVDDDDNMPSRGRSVGVVYAPDVTYLNPNATFVKDNQNKPSKKVDEMLLNKTVSLPSGSSAFGKHVPQFDFSSSRHQLSNLEILEEEDDRDSSPPDFIPKSIFPDGLGEENRDEERKRKEKTSTSSSSSSSTSSYKSAVSHLQPKKPVLVNAKKFDAIKKKEEDAQRNKEENLKRKKELQKKKNEEWKQKADKIKQEQQKLTSVKKIVNIAPSAILLNKPFVMNKPPKAPVLGAPTITQNLVSVGVNRIMDMAGGGFKASGPMKSYIKPGQLFRPMTPLIPPASAYVNLKTPDKQHSRHTNDVVFKTPGNMSGMSFLDTTSDSGPGSSYDITLYEDLDEELRHRENKKVPEWAKNQTEIVVLLLKQIGCREIKGVGFPFPAVKKGYKLFD